MSAIPPEEPPDPFLDPSVDEAIEYAEKRADPTYDEIIKAAGPDPNEPPSWEELEAIAKEAMAKEPPSLDELEAMAVAQLAALHEAAGMTEKKDEPVVLHPVRIAEVLSEQYDEDAWIVPNLLAVGALGILSADYGLGKSTILSQFLACVASGREFLGYPVAQAVGCLYWQAEGSRRLFAGRVRDQCRNLGLDLDTLPLHFVPRGMDPLPFDSRDFAEFVTDSGCKLVACDTFPYFSDGDENSAKDWKQKVSKPLKALGRATGISFVLVHHEGKPNEFRKGRHKIRGSSAMGGDCDTVLRLERIPDSPNGRILAIDKVKDTEEQPDILMDFGKTTAVFTREGVAEAAMPQEPREKVRGDAKDEKHRKAMEGFELLLRRAGSAGMTNAECRGATGRGVEWVSTAAADLHAADRIRWDSVPRKRSDGKTFGTGAWVWKS